MLKLRGLQGPSFFMKRFLFSPVTHLNLLIVGFLILVQGLHTHAHYTMEFDTDSYVRAFCKKNMKTCKNIVNGYN